MSATGLRAGGETKNKALQEDSGFELHENTYQNICTKMGVEHSFPGKPGAANAKSKKKQEKQTIFGKEKRILDSFLGLAESRFSLGQYITQKNLRSWRNCCKNSQTLSKCL